MPMAIRGIALSEAPELLAEVSRGKGRCAATGEVGERRPLQFYSIEQTLDAVIADKKARLVQRCGFEQYASHAGDPAIGWQQRGEIAAPAEAAHEDSLVGTLLQRLHQHRQGGTVAADVQLADILGPNLVDQVEQAGKFCLVDPSGPYPSLIGRRRSGVGGWRNDDRIGQDFRRGTACFTALRGELFGDAEYAARLAQYAISQQPSVQIAVRGRPQ